MFRIIRRVMIYLFLLLAFGLGFYAMSIMPSTSEQKEKELAQMQQETNRKRVQVMRVQPEPFEQTILVPGVVEAYSDVSLGAGISGIVEEVLVQEGDRVRAGQELFQIDLRARQAMLDEAESSYELARKNFERMKPLYEKGDISPQKFDEAESQVRQASATVRRMQVEVSLGHVTAPIDGIIDQVIAERGEFKGEGMTLARLLQVDNVKARIGIPERHADAAAQEKTAQVYIEALEEEYEARIERVAYGANEQTNTFEALLVMENPGNRIRPGMIVRGRFTVKRDPQAILIPLFALVKREEGLHVFVEKNGLAHAIQVKTGATQGDRAEILDGLEFGDRLIVIGHKDLVDQQEVEVMEEVTRFQEILSQNEPSPEDIQP